MRTSISRSLTKRILACVLFAVILVSPLLTPASEQKPIRILLLGTDRLGYRTVSEDESLSRADAILILAIQPGSSGIRVLSVERDYQVKLNEEQGVNKLSTATYFGGTQMALDAVNNLFQTDLVYYMQVDIPSAIGIIDSLGGIEIDIREDELAVVHASPILGPDIKAGAQHLNGKQAQAFMRVRDMGINPIESNAQRNERQMRVITAILKRLPQMGLSEAVAVASDILPMISTNMPVYDLLLLTQSILSGGLDLSIEYQRSPSTPFKTKRVNMHLVVQVTNMDKEIEAVRDFLLYTD